MLQKETTSVYKEDQGNLLKSGSAKPGLLLLRSWRNALLARRGPLAYLPVVVAVILLYCGASWQLFHAHTDVARYQCYALTFWRGSQGTHLLPGIQCAFLYQLGMSPGTVSPFHIVPFEYPPLTLGIFSLALLAPLLYYQVVFALLMAVVAILIYWLLQRHGPRGAGLVCAFYLVLGAWATTEGRFDLVPAGLTLLSLIAADRRRWCLAYIALAFGFLLKIYPVLLLPALFLAEQTASGRVHRPAGNLTIRALPGEAWQTLRGAGRWRWTNILLFFALSLLVTGLFAFLNFRGAFINQFSYFAGRPVQIEATGSTILWLATLAGHPAYVLYSFGSFNVISDLDAIVAQVFAVFFVLGYGLTIFLQWRGKLDVSQAFIALVLVFVVTGKVFSPQYLIWLVPLLAYNGAFSRLWLILWTSLSLLTTAIYPYYYSYNPDIRTLATTPGFVEIVALRNMLLLVVALAFLFNWWNMNRRKEIAPV